MNRASTKIASGLLLFAALLGAAAWIRADDGPDESSDPQPLFAPADSIRLLPEGTTGVDDARIESKEALYERLRQSLLRLEERLQSQEQSVAVPEPPAVPLVQPVDVTPEETDPPTEHHTAEPAPGIELAPPPMSVHIPDEEPSDLHTPPSEHTHAVSTPTEPAPHATHANVSPELEAQGNPNLAALADNLYALGEYTLAYNTYQQIDFEAANVEDQIWLTYQMAGCLRHQGQTEDAGQLYRSLLSKYPDHHLAGISGFWLDSMAESAEHRRSTAELREAVTEVQEYRDAALGP